MSVDTGKKHVPHINAEDGWIELQDEEVKDLSCSYEEKITAETQRRRVIRTFNTRR